MSSSRPELRLDWCSYAAAKYAVEKWHYSRSVPNQKTAKVGIWEDGAYIGCVLFGSSANNNLGKPYGLAGTQACELVRVALSRHASPVSRIVRLALLFLKRQSPGIRLVVSYADPEHGHHGGIYQAGGWLYAGMTDSADEYMVRGVRMHGRALRSTRSTHRHKNLGAINIMEWARAVLDPGITQVDGSRKHRYLMPLDDAMRAQIAPLARPYPKRAKHPGDAPAVQAVEGGSIPTRTLQTAHAT